MTIKEKAKSFLTNINPFNGHKDEYVLQETPMGPLIKDLNRVMRDHEYSNGYFRHLTIEERLDYMRSLDNDLGKVMKKYNIN